MTPSSVLQPLEARFTALPWPARLLDTLGSYLPMLVMGLMALGSWWLVKNTPLDAAPSLAAAPRHDPDYTMHQFSVQRFLPSGPLRAQIDGEVLRHYPDTDTIEVENPTVRAYAADGGVTVASARRGLSNADATEVQLLGDAQVTRFPTATDEGLTFRGEFLHVFLQTEQVRSHLPSTVTRGATEIRADSFSYDNLNRVVSMAGHVRASFAPQGAKAGANATGGLTK